MNEEEREETETRDTYKISYLIHFFLGAGNLLPWNTLITAIDYFGYLYPHRHVEKVFAMSYMTSSVTVVILMLSWGKLKRKFKFRFRMNFGFSMFVSSLIVIPIKDYLAHQGSGSGSGSSSRSSSLELKSSIGYYLTVSSVVICGLADGLVAGTLIGSAGKLPKQYMQAIFAGTASSGKNIPTHN